MSPISLFNLIPHPQRLPDAAARGQIGPFEIALTSSYDDAVQLVQNPESADEELPFTWYRIIAGCWAVTAQATCAEGTTEQSVLSSSPRTDGGLNDLLELLTFFTGRRVATESDLRRYHPAGAGDCCVHPLALFRIVAAAWPQRLALVQNGMQLALVYHNCATDYATIPIKAGVYNTALNILIDKWSGIGAASIPRSIRNDLVGRVATAVDGCPGLDDVQKEAYKALLRGKVLQGTDSMHTRLVGLLQSLDIIATPCDEATNRRIRYVNTARNAFTHSGAMPRFAGMEQDASNLLTVAIVECMVREINQLAICRILQVDPGCVLAGTDLRTFFQQGLWAGQQLEPSEESMEDLPAGKHE